MPLVPKIELVSLLRISSLTEEQELVDNIPGNISDNIPDNIL